MKKETPLHNRHRWFRLPAVLLCAVLLCWTAAYPAVARAAGDQAPENGRTTADPIGRSEGYSAVLYNNMNGLPTSEANDIAATSEGFLWIGSYSGLVRYDGNTFERMDSSSGITSVKCLLTDSRDRLWIGTNDNGLACMDQGELRWWGRSEGLKATSVRDIAEDRNGMIYVGTTRGLALIDTEGNLRNLEDARILDPFIHDVNIGADGLVYGLTNAGDVLILRDGVLIKYLDHEKSALHGFSYLFPDPLHAGYVYAETKDAELYYGILENDFEDRQPVDVAPLKYVQRLASIDGNIWICARNGIGVLLGGKFHMLKNVPMNNSVGNVMEDYEGNLWFTSTRQGVMKIVPNLFLDVMERYNLPEMVVNSTCLHDNMLFIATDTGLKVLSKDGVADSIPLTEARTASGEPLTEKEEGQTDLLDLLDGVRIRSVIRDSRGRLWISTWRKYGLLRYEQGRVTAFTADDGMLSDQVRAVCEREDGSILAAMTGGVCIIDGDSVKKRYGEGAGIVNTEILTVADGKNGDILLGTDGGGIFIISDSGTRHIGADEGLTSENVMRIKRDKERDLYWVITGNCIACLTADYQLQIFGKFPYSNNFDLYENSQGELWVLSSNGLYVVKAEELLTGEKVEYQYYGMSNGLPCIATANSYSELTEDGNLYIAGSTGIARVNIESVSEGTGQLKMAVPYVDADGTRIYPDKSGGFSIDAGVRKLIIYAYVYNYSLLDPQISYCLEGFDREKVTLPRSSLGPVNYTNLPGGSYRFILESRDPMSGSASEIDVQITKTRALHEETWFFVLIGLAGILCTVGLAVLYFHNKIRAIEKKHREEAEKERIVTELTMAGKIQNSLLPHIFPPYPDREEFDLFASMTPAREVGGDFYDFFLIDDDHLCLVIADVSGKGIPAALFMMVSKVIVQSCAMPDKTAAEIITRTNDALCANNTVDMFVTAWLGILELSTGRLTAVNAGHEYPVLKRPDGPYELLKDKHGLVIGGMEGTQYKEYELILEPGSRVFVYTDGIPEASDAGKNMFGTERMVNALNREPDASPEKLLANVQQAVADFVKKAEQFDDMTMLCLEYRGNGKK